MKRRMLFAGVAGVAGTLVASRLNMPAYASTATYDQLVLEHGPKHYYPRAGSNLWPDVVRGVNGRFPNGRSTITMPDGSLAPRFDGATQYAIMPDSSFFGPAGAQTAWTFTCWLRPSVLNYANDRSTGYVHWIGKRRDGRDGEWLMRIYNLNSDRPSWLSGYVLSPAGGSPSAGQSYRGGLVVGQWYHIAFVVRRVSRQVGLFVNGRQSRGWVSMDAYRTVVRNGTAPLIIGRDSQLDPDNGKPRSWFRGTVGKPAFFTYDLSVQGVSEQYPAGRISRQAEAL
jgi:hypothetical protein